MPALHDATARPSPSFWAAAAAYAQRHPGGLLTIALALHLVVWTLLPLLLSPNLQLDLVEGLALGKEWQLGYWKHPPLPWWIDDIALRLTGSLDSVYVLGPAAVIACMIGVWLLAREIVGPFEALIATLALEGIHFYNFSAVKFAHDQLQLPFWAFTALFFYRAIARGRLVNWTLAGAFLAGAFWSKYAAVILGASLGLFLVFDPVARRAWRTPGPYVMALTFAVLIAPNTWWLVVNDFMPIGYADHRAKAATQWYLYLVFPVRWTAGQALNLLPAAAVLALLYRQADLRIRPATTELAAFNRRYVTLLAIGPFVLTMLIATAAGRLPITMWAYPFWSFAPLAVLLWIGLPANPLALRRSAAGLVGILVTMPVIYLAVEFIEPYLRDRYKATQFPGRMVAETVTRAWHEAYGTPLAYVGGSEFATNNVAVYSADRPHAIPHGRLNFSPWVDIDDLRRHGALVIWELGLEAPDIDVWRKTFSGVDQPRILTLTRKRGPAIDVRYVLVPPQP